jgi:hypothetical protein
MSTRRFCIEMRHSWLVNADSLDKLVPIYIPFNGRGRRLLLARKQLWAVPADDDICTGFALPAGGQSGVQEICVCLFPQGQPHRKRSRQGSCRRASPTIHNDELGMRTFPLKYHTSEASAAQVEDQRLVVMLPACVEVRE